MHMKQMRSVLQAVRMVGEPCNRGKRFLVLGDNLGVVFVISEGRCTNVPLLHLQRKLAACCLASGSAGAVRWICSELNPADEDSRRLEPPKLAKYVKTSKTEAHLPGPLAQEVQALSSRFTSRPEEVERPRSFSRNRGRPILGLRGPRDCQGRFQVRLFAGKGRIFGWATARAERKFWTGWCSRRSKACQS